MSDNTNINNNNKVIETANMTERQSSANTTSNNILVNQSQPTQQQQFNILQQLNLPLSIPPPPAAFQIPAIHFNANYNPKLDPKAPAFTPDPFSTINIGNTQNTQNTPGAVQGYKEQDHNSLDPQIQHAQNSVNESLAKLQILALQLNTLNLINQQNKTLQSLQQYQSVYNQYQLEFTNSMILNQYMSNLQVLAAQNKALLNEKEESKTKKNGVGQLETIEEGEEDETEEIAEPHIAGLDTGYIPKMSEDEGTAAFKSLSKKVDEALSVYETNKMGEKFADSKPVQNLWKFQQNTGNETETNTKDAVIGESENRRTGRKSELESIKKQIRGILNKITPENFDKLSQDITSILRVAEISQNQPMDEQLMIAQKAQFKALIKLILKCILEKAINESLFSNQYARLCYSLYLRTECNELKKKIFRQQLLSLCHSTFKKARNKAESQRFIGIITMIGNLFTYGLISWNVISSGIFDELLPPSSGLDIEAVCKLLKTSGNDFDRHHDQEINAVIKNLIQYAAKYDFRTQCLVKEIDEMRQNDWNQKIKKEAPMTLKQVQREFNKEKNVKKTADKKTATYRPSNSNQRPQRWRNNNNQRPYHHHHNNNNYNQHQYNHNAYNNSYHSRSSQAQNRWNSNRSNNKYGYHQYNNNQRRKTKSLRPTVEFVKDVTLPDRTHYPSNTVLTKTWEMRNSGELAWGDNVELVYFKGDETLSLEKRYAVINAAPGQKVQMSATIRTPNQPGRYCTYFRLQKNGKFFGPRVWVDIIVNAEMKPVQAMRARTDCATNQEANNAVFLSCQ